MTTQEILDCALSAKMAVNAADEKTKNQALACMADALIAHTDQILAATDQD